MNTHMLLKHILVYNVNSTSNEDRQISKVVDVILCYQFYSKWALFIVFSLEKQDLILGFMRLKNHNLEVN